MCSLYWMCNVFGLMSIDATNLSVPVFDDEGVTIKMTITLEIVFFFLTSHFGNLISFHLQV